MEAKVTNHGRVGTLSQLQQPRPPALRYCVALLLCGLASAINFIFPRFSSLATALPFFVTTSVAAWYGGFRAGMLASLVSLLIVEYYFLPSRGLAIDLVGFMKLMCTGVVMIVISWLIDNRARDQQLIETQREQAKDQERRHQAIVASAARIAGMGSWEYDMVNDRREWDDETLRIFGVTRESFGGSSAEFFALVHPDDREALRAMQLRAWTSNGIIEMEYRIIRPDGAVRRVYDRGQITSQDSGKPIQSTGMVMDVTEQRKAVKELRESKERYEAAIRGAEAGLWDWNILTNEVFYSPHFKGLLGYRDDEFPNVISSFLDVLHPDDLAPIQECIRRHLEERAPYNVTYRLRTKSGEYRRFNVSGMALWNGDGIPYRMAGSLVDITDRLFLEERSRRSQRIEAVGRLAGGIAHDFNNMLGVILGHCNSLEETLPAAIPEWQKVRHIKEAASRSASLTHQLLAFSRNQILMVKVLDLNDVICELSAMLDSLIGDDIELVVCPGSQLGYIKADPGQISQVVMNLAVNARDAMPDGGQVRIATSNITVVEHPQPGTPPIAPGPYVMLSVSDTGCGIEPETLDHVFEPFFTTKKLGEGTGLGLATVYGIVKQSGGYVIAESELGQGSTFRIYLPQAVGEKPPAVAELEETEAERGEETILIAEDEPLLREVVSFHLQEAGYTVLEADNGQDAIQMARSHQGKIHLLLTDVVMTGGINGLELAANLGALQPGLKVIYMTGYAADLIDQKGMANLQNRMLQKPFSADTLRRKIREVLLVA